MDFISKASESPLRPLGALRRQITGAFGHRDFTRFIILSRSRTGSNLLLSLLNSHPNVQAEWEIFARLDGEPHDRRLARAFGRQPRRIRAKGFKLFYYHPLDDNSDALWRDLVADQALRVIHLKRRNILRCLVSRKIAAQRDAWSAAADNTGEAPRRKTVSFTTSELQDGFSQTRAWEHMGDRDFRHHRLLSLAYEDMAAQPAATLERVQRFLSLPPARLNSDMRKQNPEPLSHLIANYDDLKQAFAGSQWSLFFEE
jgi:LPS sulfotransferase NodH